jgi:hypothetical protein
MAQCHRRSAPAAARNPDPSEPSSESRAAGGLLIIRQRVEHRAGLQPLQKHGVLGHIRLQQPHAAVPIETLQRGQLMDDIAARQTQLEDGARPVCPPRRYNPVVGQWFERRTDHQSPTLGQLGHQRRQLRQPGRTTFRIKLGHVAREILRHRDS